MRTLLPPNLTRNHYEVKRLIAEGEGRQLPHWYQLTGEQKRAEELEVELFRRAIFRAEEEQDLVSNFNAPAAESAAAPCDCPGCSTRRATTQLFGRAQQDAKRAASLGWDVGSDGDGAHVYAFTFAAPTAKEAEEYAAREKQAREAVQAWLASGKPVRPLAEFGPAKPTYTLAFLPPLLCTTAYLDRLMKRIIREPYPPRPAAFLLNVL
ncbi:hypothetical protein ACFWCA_19290 [Streptomyces phaeochromogenes]|uniref:hypothetical protein n=1 Tax=Streptomyces phaeochromogenes TaxID=1923 RepID=UPI0036B4A043